MIFAAYFVYHSSSFWVFSWLIFFGFCHNLSFWVCSQFEFLSFIKFWVFEFHHSLSCFSCFFYKSDFKVLSQFVFWVFTTICFHNKFLSCHKAISTPFYHNFLDFFSFLLHKIPGPWRPPAGQSSPGSSSAVYGRPSLLTETISCLLSFFLP